MRIWDVDPKHLCRKHLLGEHRELHGLWNILVHNKKGYSKHPETLRWVGKLPALRKRHDALVKEMSKRGYNHKSPLIDKVCGKEEQDAFVNSIDEQFSLLDDKGCDCKTNGESFV